MTDADWAKLGNDFMQRMGLMNHQYIIVKPVSYTHLDVYKRQGFPYPEAQFFEFPAESGKVKSLHPCKDTVLSLIHI